MNEVQLPLVLDPTRECAFPALVERELQYITEARDLFESGFYSYSLLAVWNAAVNNLKRRIEAYGVDLWTSVIKEESGRKGYKRDGETLSERWGGVDDLVLIAGATKLGLLNPKAGKALEMINWMRNHASPAHDSDHRVEREDVIGLVILLQRNLFEAPLPDPGHSVSSLFDPVRSVQIGADQYGVMADQVRALRVPDVRICFGFMLDLICNGVEPGYSNSKNLFPIVWERANDDLRRTAGIKYHSFTVDPDSDESADKGAKTRLLETLVELNGVAFIPDGTRARLFRKAAQKLAQAKDTSYGWASEESAARMLVQLGTSIPSVAFEEVYQEILTVWCGNYWGRSKCHLILEVFIAGLNTDQLRTVMGMFRTNARVQSELFERKARRNALQLLGSFEARLTLEAHRQELRETIQFVEQL